MRAEVHFTSPVFNSTEPRDYFVNPGCYGDDVCRWVSRGLRARGFVADEEPGQEDWGWYVRFEAGGAEHLFLVGFQPGDHEALGRWRGWLERTGAFRTLLGRRSRDVLPSAVEAIEAVLSSSPDVRDVKWIGRR